MDEIVASTTASATVYIFAIDSFFLNLVIVVVCHVELMSSVQWVAIFEIFSHWHCGFLIPNPCELRIQILLFITVLQYFNEIPSVFQ